MSNKAKALEGQIQIEGIGKGRGRLRKHYAILKIRTVAGEMVKVATALDSAQEAIDSVKISCAKMGVGFIAPKRVGELANMVQAAMDNVAVSERSYQVLDVPGWHGNHYATPRCYFQGNKERLIYAMSGVARPWRWKQHGNSRAWYMLARRAGQGNFVIIFLVMAALMAPLLRLVDLPGVGFCLVGQTSTGKSIILKLVGSVWGGDASGDDKHGFADTLRMTPNAHELLMRQASDGLLILDDTQNLRGKAADSAEVLRTLVFNLTSGGDALRLNTPGQAFASRLVFMMASNERLENLLMNGGVRVDDSFSVRCIQLPVNGAFGIFDHLPFGKNPAEYSKEVEAQAREHYGHASRQFLESLVEWRARDEVGLKSWIGKKMRKAKAAMGINGQDGATDRIADYFALAYAAGAMAQKFDILPWHREEMLEAVVEVFAKARAFSSIKASLTEVHDRLRRHILEHEEKFLRVRCDGKGIDKKEFDAAPGVKYRSKAKEVEYLFSRRQFTELFGQGPLLESAVKQLVASGNLVADGGAASSRKHQTKRPIIGEKRERARVYCVRSDILNEVK